MGMLAKPALQARLIALLDLRSLPAAGCMR
jgi:hypothetical protein